MTRTERIYAFLAALLAMLAGAIDRRTPGGGSDEDDDTDQWLRPA